MKILVLSVLGLFLAFCGFVQAIDESLVLYVSLDEGQGNSAKDGSLAKTHGKYVGKPKWVVGKLGKAIDAPGGKEHISIYADPAVFSINTSKRIVKLANTNITEVATFSTDTANGAFVKADVRYIRVTNLDGTDALQVGLDDEDSDAAYTSVAANSSIIYTGTTVEGDNGGSTLDAATALKVKGIANQQLEVFIASV